MPEEMIKQILEEAESLGIAFVEDDFEIHDDGSETYNPMVDRENALSWLGELLRTRCK